MGIIRESSSDLNALIDPASMNCTCGKVHSAPVKQIAAGSGVLEKIGKMATELGMTRPVVISDRNTYAAAGDKVCRVLEHAGISYQSCCLDTDCPVPDEYWVGRVALNFDRRWDGIIAVGSGTINDICKIIADMTKLPYILAGTAPSMDGYVSGTSSMVRGGLKVSVPSKCPDGLLLDSSVLANAPMKMLQAGLGDMAAKYVSICEWRISNLINGEYYCEEIAGLIRKSLKTCMDSGRKLAERDQEAAADVAKGLVMAGMCMSYAGVSRPASGMEHYFSHIWEMTALARHESHELHGIQVGVGTLLSLAVYEEIRDIKPDREKALAYVENFDMEQWKESVRSAFGKAGESIISLEEKEQKYNKQSHALRLERIISKWDEIQEIIRQELPDREWLTQQLLMIGAPVTPQEIGISQEMVKKSFMATKDIRDKYIASRLLWDLGMLEEVAEKIF